ncbi:MAG: ABC transporter permease [Candidatus Hydrogenedentes bacterium]|nr:ABC transporter permease [Candidatus Hydrogenedentota bacterium]
MTTHRIACPPTLNQETGRALLDDAKKEPVARGEAILLDFAQTRKMDARGGAWVVALADYAYANSAEFRWEGEQGDVADFVALIEPGLHPETRKQREAEGFTTHVGASALAIAAEVREFAGLVVDATYWTLIGPLEGRGFRWGLWTDELYEMGVRAIRINFLMNFLLGLTIAMMSAAQLREFGLGIYVANLVMIGFARELAAIMTAVVVSARTGAAIAAELATMKVQEEIDALQGMGLNVSQFLVAPKLLALLVVMPCLTALGMLAGIAGGSVWGVLVLEIRLDAWLNQTLSAATLDDIWQGMAKSLAFAVVIVLIGCHNGLRVRGGSRGVGLMTTRAVVMDIFAIVVIDMMFATLFYYVLE